MATKFKLAKMVDKQKSSLLKGMVKAIVPKKPSKLKALAKMKETKISSPAKDVVKNIKQAKSRLAGKFGSFKA